MVAVSDELSPSLLTVGFENADVDQKTKRCQKFLAHMTFAHAGGTLRLLSENLFDYRAFPIRGRWHLKNMSAGGGNIQEIDTRLNGMIAANVRPCNQPRNNHIFWRIGTVGAVMTAMVA